LESGAMNFVILRFDTLVSTNLEALEQARRGADEGTCIVARQQTAGRGRHGRTWQSPPGAGLYFSVISRPQIEAKFLPLLTLMAAIAVFDTLCELYPVKPDIKWVNDILVGGKKICGILAESTETEKGQAVIIGIGINFTSENFPPEIAQTATSIEALTGDEVDPDVLLPALTKNIALFYELLHNENGVETIKNEWAKRSSYHTGKDVRVILPAETLIGTTCGLDEYGGLRVKQPDGEIRIVHAGDVENLRAV
jgi:BirA family biotin operon repressor/biotin-[acetyl-CoA-carboxylase] ligase